MMLIAMESTNSTVSRWRGLLWATCSALALFAFIDLFPCNMLKSIPYRAGIRAAWMFHEVRALSIATATLACAIMFFAPRWTFVRVSYLTSMVLLICSTVLCRISSPFN
jgi:hypothetical protein